jgi:hypothetical protein
LKYSLAILRAEFLSNFIDKNANLKKKILIVISKVIIILVYWGIKTLKIAKIKSQKRCQGRKKLGKKIFHQARNQFLRKYGKKHKRGSKRGGGEK